MMEILIWGTGKRGKETKRICDKNNWSVKAFIDNDRSRVGNLEGTPVIAPDDISHVFSSDMQIWIATGASEVYGQAKKIASNVIGWEFVQLLIRAYREKPAYPEVQLKEQNIQNCKLVMDRKAFLNQFVMESSKWTMAEVGVAFGDFSEQILKICSPQKLYLVDLWEDERYGSGASSIQDKFKHEIEAGIIEVRQGYSTQKLDEFEDYELDWVYIDTAHDYTITKKELELCQSKIKHGGYICGHDYAKYNVYSRCDYGVYDAVNEFAVNEGYEFLYLTMETHGLQSFCLRKIAEGHN
ncbi:MAG: class I SAM-dependent methyltransferase [Lachnospiraceae bacterium]|nr:class I SAM-dependent methyltransferase [Lachnospiraceae bacterium]